MKPCCYVNLTTGQSVCSQPAAFRAYYADCTTCADDTRTHCAGADICADHAIVERTNPDLILITTLAEAAKVARP